MDVPGNRRPCGLMLQNEVPPRDFVVSLSTVYTIWCASARGIAEEQIACLSALYSTTILMRNMRTLLDSRDACEDSSLRTYMPYFKGQLIRWRYTVLKVITIPALSSIESLHAEFLFLCTRHWETTRALALSTRDLLHRK